MALVTQVSNLRTYNLKFSDFGINQAVEQPIPVEPNRTVPKEIDRRQDDVTRLNAFLFSGKGATFASKQAGLGQDLSLELNPRKRLTAAANTAARLVNIALQASPAGEITRFSSNPFGRYIEARGLVGQIGNFLQPRDAPSLARRGKPIIPDYEARETTGGEEGGFFRGIARRLKIVRDVNSIVEDIDDDSTSLKKRLETPDSPGSKFDEANTYTGTGYVEGPAPRTRRDFSKTVVDGQLVGSSLIKDLSVANSVNDEVDVGVEKVDERGTNDVDKKSLKKRFEGQDTTTSLNLGQPVRQPESDVTLSIREKSKYARRDSNYNFIVPERYVTSSIGLEQAFDSDVSDIKIDIITPERAERLLFTAFIDSFSDSYTGDWNSTNYIGRAEPVYNYTGFKRDYSFNFKVASFSVNELKELYRKLNTLAGTTAPTYSGTFMRGTFVRLKIGDYLDSTPGFISSIGFSWNTTYPWQAQTEQEFKNIDEGGVYDNVPLLPHILDVSCNFTPIHNFIPQTNTNSNLTDFAYIASTDLNNTLTAVSPETEQSSQQVQQNNSTGEPASNNEDAESFGYFALG